LFDKQGAENETPRAWTGTKNMSDGRDCRPDLNRGLGNVVGSPNGVRVRAPTENEFGSLQFTLLL